MFFLFIVIIVRDVEERFFGGGRSRKGVKRRKSTGATLVGESNGGGAGGDVGHSEGREGHREKRGNEPCYHISTSPVHGALSRGQSPGQVSLGNVPTGPDVISPSPLVSLYLPSSTDHTHASSSHSKHPRTPYQLSLSSSYP
jgi:hypothetical protein